MNITDLKEQIRAAVIAHLAKVNRGQRQFAANAGVDWADLSKWLSGKKKTFSDENMDAIINELNRATNETQR